MNEKDISLLKALERPLLTFTDLEYIKNEVWPKIQDMPHQQRYKELSKAVIKLKYS